MGSLLGSNALLVPTAPLSALTLTNPENLLMGASPLGKLKWYLPVRTPQDQAQKSDMNGQAVTASEQLTANIVEMNKELVLDIARIPKRFRIERGYNDDPKAGIGSAFTPSDSDPLVLAERGPTRFDMGEDGTLVLDAERGEIALERDGAVAQLWGDARPDALAVAAATGGAAFDLPNGGRLSLETVPARDHANAVIAERITVEREGRSLSLRADG